jgi:uncharacterized protein (DUF1800 family)
MIDSFVGKYASSAVSEIIGDGTDTLPEPPDKQWVDKPFEDPLKAGNQSLRAQIEGQIRQAHREFIDWWLNLIRNDSQPYREKFVLFWSSLWPIEFTYDTLSLMPPGLSLRNNQTLRKNRFANYKDFVLDVTLDGAMILYQSLFFSNRNTANENYMREVMELFTMGTGDIITGSRNYTEGDIKEGAKVLTGWRTGAYLNEPAPKGYYNTYFSPNDHILDSKTFMTKTIAARSEDDNTEDLVKRDEVQRLIDIMFEERKLTIGRYIADKIYKYFVYSNRIFIEKDIVNSMAQIFIDNNYSLKPLFHTLFSSSHFFDEANIGIQIKRPVEFIIGLERLLGVRHPDTQTAISELEQVLYDPPNVGSWKDYRTWLSTKTLPLRNKHAKLIISQLSDSTAISFAKKFNNYDDASLLVNSIVEIMLARYELVELLRIEKYKEILLNGLSESQWQQAINTGSSQVAEGIRNLLNDLITAPDFQLC